MIRMSLTVALLVAAAAPLAAQQQQAAPVIVDGRIAAMRDDALANDHYAWDIVEGLTTEVGQRLAGTDAEARARAWAVKRLTAMGFADVRVEEFPVPVWTRGAESAEILSPFPQKLAVAALGNSASTGPAGVTGEIVAYNSVEELRAAPDAAVKGKIVFIDHNMKPTQDGSSYGPGGTPRRSGPTLASKKGAIAIIVRSAGTDLHRNPHTGVQTFGDGATPIPAGAISVPDALQLQRILKRGQPVTLRLTLVSQTRQGTSGNVIAEIPGRDPSLAPILVGGHLDSWDLGTGAIDDASGVAIATAAAKRIMDGGRPLRTIRIVWFGSEEIGLFGGLDYRARYGKLPHYALLESDFGADRIWRVESQLGKDRLDEARRIGAALAPLGIVTGSFEEADGSDIGPMLADGLPGVGLSQDGTRYFDYHHTPDDTLDKIDPAQLKQNVAAWTAALAILAGPIEPNASPTKRKR
ncbi:M28 family peptidase [Sphingomonas jaspsi]|uniref:M28 family peptidase n=1 Tax=Sphingomonas jaspsi TaxID=392409 RepID=UPI0005652CCF|nr:M28 family peptidase [Sphingomonas jaspsi]